MIWISLAGCGVFDPFEKVKDDLEGLTNPVVALGWVVGVEAPSQPELAPLVASGALVPGTAFNLFVGDATDADQLDESGIDGAQVLLDAGAESAEAAPQGDGLYAIEPGPDSPPYDAGASWVATIDLGDAEAHALTFALPPAADLTIDPMHAAGTPISLDLTGQDFHAALVVVLDVVSGDPTYSNEPTSAEEVFELLQSREPLTTATIPGEAFPGPGTYAIGIAGMRRGEDDTLEGVNTALSRGMAGTTKFFPILVP